MDVTELHDEENPAASTDARHGLQATLRKESCPTDGDYSESHSEKARHDRREITASR